MISVSGRKAQTMVKMNADRRIHSSIPGVLQCRLHGIGRSGTEEVKVKNGVISVSFFFGAC